MRIDMGGHLPKEAVSWTATTSTLFMLPLYKPVIQFYKPSPLNDMCMSRDVLRQSLIAVLSKCPLVFARVTAQPDRSLVLEYNPENSNNPVLEFNNATVSYADLETRGFRLSDVSSNGLNMPVEDGMFTESFESPLLKFKVSFLSDGGIALYSTRHHVLFDGNALFSFVSNWARCTRMLAQNQVPIPPEMSLVQCLNKTGSPKPAEITVDTTQAFSGIVAAIKHAMDPNNMRSCVFSIAASEIKRLKQQTMDSGLLLQGEWVSSNNVLTAFIAHHITRANMDACVYERGPWVVYNSLDMRRLLGLPLRGIGSPLFTVNCLVSYDELMDAKHIFQVAYRVRKCVERCTNGYLQDANDWIAASYKELVKDGIQEPWNHLSFTMLDSNARNLGVSCMDKIPVYDADFGAGRPEMVRSLDNISNYVIALPSPQSDAYHLHVCLEGPAMDALMADPGWNSLCSLMCDS
ncbi:hypothetical protein IW139_003215 [Coemansia sp. RSA 353]|nr:hypothetical protein IW145_005397 [Coemansia sp. RSA 521]KAJ2296710.1 hypothetical protein IW139_003215 [Coemansia sp. RSA 353]KAJ2404000.1 hypothetical protein J3F80_005167 [Coemansia sp. RSA 2526]